MSGHKIIIESGSSIKKRSPSVICLTSTDQPRRVRIDRPRRATLNAHCEQVARRSYKRMYAEETPNVDPSLRLRRCPLLTLEARFSGCSNEPFRLPRCTACERDLSQLHAAGFNVMVTRCGHLVCADCANDRLMTARYWQSQLRCPCCRDVLYYPEQQSLPAIFPLNI